MEVPQAGVSLNCSLFFPEASELLEALVGPCTPNTSQPAAEVSQRPASPPPNPQLWQWQTVPSSRHHGGMSDQ